MHTKEPWVWCVNSLDSAITIEQDALEHDTDEPVIVVDIVADMGSGLNRETAMHNARRIVECVNACKDFKNPQERIDSMILDLQLAADLLRQVQGGNLGDISWMDVNDIIDSYQGGK